MFYETVKKINRMIRIGLFSLGTLPVLIFSLIYLVPDGEGKAEGGKPLLSLHASSAEAGKKQEAAQQQEVQMMQAVEPLDRNHPDLILLKEVEKKVVTEKGGLGDDFSTMENTFGVPTKIQERYEYQKGTLRVKFSEGRVTFLHHDYLAAKKLVSVEQVMYEINGMIPEDAQFTRVEEKENGGQVYYFHSEELASLLSPELFPVVSAEGKPGVFSVEFYLQDNYVTNIKLFAGEKE